ncbi:alpha/beta-hydrolase [Aulographum hederae CBS 113979]|uniref:Alpha/beta-hydrolase n=1 Tax=Aulographum hederae CBS 113979 TaxID=1176131 RepID=A0A6G1GRG6_9PEZI|nr:alpha/beta-hydrolase [Aulographum hederae CBS 113979]
MPFLSRPNGVQIYYNVHGPLNTTNPPILLTHGFTSTSALWTPQLSGLSAFHTLITYDMRGHGRSSSPSSPAEYTIEHNVADMLALLDLICRPNCKAVIGGLSLGGFMSLAFWKKHPERVCALIVTCSGPGFARQDVKEEWRNAALAQAEAFEKYGLAVLNPEDPGRKGEFHFGPEGLVLAARGMLAGIDVGVVGMLETIMVPTLVVVGEDDKQFLYPAEYMAKRIPDVKKLVVPRAGHAVNVDQPEIFLDAVLTFVAQVDGEGQGAKGSHL